MIQALNHTRINTHQNVHKFKCMHVHTLPNCLPACLPACLSACLVTVTPSRFASGSGDRAEEAHVFCAGATPEQAWGRLIAEGLARSEVTESQPESAEPLPFELNNSSFFPKTLRVQFLLCTCHPAPCVLLTNSRSPSFTSVRQPNKDGGMAAPICWARSTCLRPSSSLPRPDAKTTKPSFPRPWNGTQEILRPEKMPMTIATIMPMLCRSRKGYFLKNPLSVAHTQKRPKTPGPLQEFGGILQLGGHLPHLLG